MSFEPTFVKVADKAVHLGHQLRHGDFQFTIHVSHPVCPGALGQANTLRAR